MDYRLMFKGDHIQAVEFQGKTPTLTIKSVALVELEDEKKKASKEKGVVSFKETPKGWVLNRTNAESLAAMFGAETDAWVGKRVKLQAVTVQFGKEQVPGIRVMGSPDIAKPVTFTLKLPRKRPREVTMLATAAKANGKAAPPPPPKEEEPPPPAPGEPEMDEADIPF
jgi:hypothetical protein